jgi:hypothetical protein
MAGKGKVRCRRILSLKPKGIVLPYIHSSIVRAFRGLDIEVTEVPAPDDPGNLISFLYSQNSRFDAGFALDMGAGLGFIQNLREIQATFQIPWIIWFVDDPEGYGFPGSLDPERSLVFCWDREIARAMSLNRNWNGRAVEHLPLAADPRIFYPEPLQAGFPREKGIFAGSTRHRNIFLESAAASTPGFEEKEKELWGIYSRDLAQPLYDLLWGYLAAERKMPADQIRQEPLAKIWVHVLAFALGRRKRVEAVSRLLDRGAVFGDEGWRKFLPGNYRGRIQYGGELRSAYARSHFVLDVRQPQARTGLTQRVFDAGSCGIPELTEWTPELEALFDAPEGIRSFRTIEEGIAKRDELLADERAARKRAERLRAEILVRHTYAHRIRRILKVLGKTDR